METTKDLKDVAEEFKKAINQIGEYAFEVGVFTANENREYTMDINSKGERKKRKKKDSENYYLKIGGIESDTGVTNAQLMFIHENGSPLHHIPARPVLQMTVDYVNENMLSKAIDKALKAFFDADFDKKAFEDELNRFCIRIERYARQLITSNDGRLAPNAPSTIAKKGDNHPLEDTGQLYRSIRCRLVKL